MRQATLCFLIREDLGNKELLLAIKKRGFGQGRWNGIGGKLDLKKDKDIFKTAIRETKEEIGVEVKNIEKVAILSFYFSYQKGWDQDVHVFIAESWEGEPIESEEMKPRWFKINEIPFDEMWPDDKFWLPKVLSGEKVKAEFTFKDGEIIDSYNIEVVNGFD